MAANNYTLKSVTVFIRSHSTKKDVIAQQIFAQSEAAREVRQLLFVLTCPSAKRSSKHVRPK
jgi:hypothetical protein